MDHSLSASSTISARLVLNAGLPSTKMESRIYLRPASPRGPVYFMPSMSGWDCFPSDSKNLLGGKREYDHKIPATAS